jgi:hypothetical protein
MQKQKVCALCAHVENLAATFECVDALFLTAHCYADSPFLIHNAAAAAAAAVPAW